ncbi:MAG: ParB/RepB/Spo0J family partition protein [Acidobacteriota bacterium]|nr:ParB/RepB/Spo0J family partition protein [Acidobacteriota bacterium]
MTRNALGRGLGALIREPEPQIPVTPNQLDQPQVTTPSGAAVAPARDPNQTLFVDIDLIEPSPYQPRTTFREVALAELARSIQASGIIQPLLLRPVGDRYELIAGERRWRAAQLAGLNKVPAIVREVPDELALEMTLVENIQREDLNAIESARAFDRLITEFQMTLEMVAERTGKDRTTISNAIRLLKLESTIQEWIEEGKLTAGHGRALLSVQDPPLRMRYARRASRGGLTVRQIERLASRRARNRGPITREESDPNTRSAIDELQRSLGTKIMLRPHTKTHPGQLIIEFYDDPHLMRIYDQLMK